MVAAAVIHFVEPVMKKAMPGMESRNKDEEVRKITCVQIACVVFGVLNIILSAFVIVSCFIVVGTGNSIFAKWMTPWHPWTLDESSHIPRLSELNEHAGKHYDLDSMIAIIFAILGPYIIISKGFIFLGMSTVLIYGIVKRSASTVKAFLIYTGVVLPMCIIVNIFYLVMIWLHSVSDFDLIIPHAVVLIFNMVFALELLLACKAHSQLKIAAPYNPTRLYEY